MEAAFAWVGHIADWLGRFFPRLKIVPTTHGWVKFVYGSKVLSGGAGLVWYWPLVTEFKSYPTARASLNLRAQTITVSPDQTTVLVEAMIVYAIEDIEKIAAYTWEPDETIADISISAVHEVISSLSWEQIQQQNQRQPRHRGSELDSKLKAEVGSALADYGVRVITVTLTNLAKCRVLKLVNSQD